MFIFADNVEENAPIAFPIREENIF